MPRRNYKLSLHCNDVKVGVSLDTPLPMQPTERSDAIGWLFDQCRLLYQQEKEKAERTIAVLTPALIKPAALNKLPTLAMLPPSRKVPITYVYGVNTVPRGGSANNLSSPQSASFPKFTLQNRLVQSSFGSTQTFSWVNTRNGVDLPGFRAIIKNGGNATTPMTATRQVLKATSGFLEMTFKGDVPYYMVASDSFSGCYPTGVLSSATTDSLLLSKCNTGSLDKFHKRLASITRSADVGETFAEFRQAIRMVGRPLAGMRDLIEHTERELARVRWQRFGSPALTHRITDQVAARAAAKLHLEFTFGWKPLAMDLLAMIKEAQVSRLKACPSKISSSFSSDKLISARTSLKGELNYFRLDSTETDKLRCTVRHQVGLSPEKSTADPHNYMKSIGLSWDRFIPTMYAVIPYSWLFDYFTALNVAIDALCADMSFTTWTCKTVRWEREVSLVRSVNPGETGKLLGSDLYSLSGSPFSASTKRSDVTRSVPASLVPDLITIQGLRVEQQAKNIVALILAKQSFKNPFFKAK